MSSTPLPPPIIPPPADPYNIQAVKRYIFNETGNIMLSSTEFASDNITQAVRDVFAEVAVFFAAMTKAISQSIDPVTKEPYSLYDYKALEAVIDGSGLFVHVTEEDVSYSSQSYGVTFSKELIQALLGLATGAGELGFAQAMISSIGKRGLKIGGSNSTTDSRVANIIFVCEHLLGMPIVSAIVVYVDSKKFQQQFQIGPCLKESTSSIQMNMHKDTYMFVTPKFIKEYSQDLLSVESDLQFQEFVDYLTDVVERKPLITAVETLDGVAVSGQLTANVTYAIVGIFFDETLPQGQYSGVLKFTTKDPSGGNGAIAVGTGQWQSNVITFTVTGTRSSAGFIGLYASDAATEPFLVTPGAYTIVDPNGPTIQGIYDSTGAAVSSLKPSMTYQIKGAGFGSTQGSGSLSFADTTLGGSVTISTWADTSISFSLKTPFSKPGDTTTLVVKTVTGEVAVTSEVTTSSS